MPPRAQPASCQLHHVHFSSLSPHFISLFLSVCVCVRMRVFFIFFSCSQSPSPSLSGLKCPPPLPPAARLRVAYVASPMTASLSKIFLCTSQTFYFYPNSNISPYFYMNQSVKNLRALVHFSFISGFLVVKAAK